MIALEKLRKIDDEIACYTDDELEKIRQSLYDMGQLAFEDWYEQKFGSKNPIGVLTSMEIKHKI